MFSIDGETSPITAMSFTSDNRFLMSCTNRNEVNIWKLGGDRSRISEAYMSVQTPNPPTQIFINTVSPKTYILCALSKTCLTLFHLKNKVIKNMVNSKQLIVMDPDSKLNVKSNDLQNVYMDRPNIIMVYTIYILLYSIHIDCIWECAEPEHTKIEYPWTKGRSTKRTGTL